MKSFHFECPKCNQPIETDLATALREMECPACGLKFIPRQHTAAISVKQVQLDAAGKIREHAKIFSRLSIALALIGFGALALACADHVPAFPMLVFAAICFSNCIWIYLVAQVIHIRANTEK